MPITIQETSKFLEYLWGYKDKSILNSIKDDEIILQLEQQPNEAIFHVEKRGEITVIWRAADWQLDLIKWTKEKEAAETRILEHDNRKETFLYLRQLALAHFGELAGEMLADSLVTKIMEKRDIKMATMLGADLERLKW